MKTWNDTHTAMLRELYPVESLERTAELIGFSRTTIRQKAARYGIDKAMNPEWLEKADVIRNNFDSFSYSELAGMTGSSKTTVVRIASALGLKRTRKVNSGIRSRVRKAMVKREKRRIIFGLDPVTGIKVVTNRTKIRLRSELKAAGYIVERAANILYFKSEDGRNLRKEQKASRHGLRFAPWPYEEESLATAI